MNRECTDLLACFADDEATVVDRWTAARELMAARKLVSAANTDEFRSGYRRVGNFALEGNDLERLIAVDLIVRLSKFVKKLDSVAENMLRHALETALPPISLLSESDALPERAKPAELRENVAYALKFASEDWVIPYAVRALLTEDRSQKCRLELARQLSNRERSIDQWLFWIVESWLGTSHNMGDNIENAAARLRDIATALADSIKQNRTRLEVSQESGVRINQLCRLLVPLPPKSSLPKRLGSGAAGVANLLDEIFAVKLTLIVEPEAYTVLETFERWWRPIPYPKQLFDALQPIVDKLVTGLTLRARWGQKSEELGVRLKQSLGSRQEAARRLRKIAEDEPGLSVEVDDWLHGRKRISSEGPEVLADSLRTASDEELGEAIASLLLDAEEVLDSPGEGAVDSSMDHAYRLAVAVKSLASKKGMETVGSRGDLVEYFPLAHQAMLDRAPTNPTVRVVRADGCAKEARW